MKKIAIFSTRNVKSAYSCLLYLKEALETKYQVDLWAFTETKDVPTKYNKNFHSLIEKWYGKIRRVRLYAAKLTMLAHVKDYDAFIINDLDFFRMGYYIKKRYPEKIIIHYNTEIHDVDIKYPWHTITFYNKRANYPDMIIECLKERAEYRKRKYRITQDIYVINNTLPKRDLDEYLSKECDINQYLQFENDLPIVIYAGGCNMSRCLGDVIRYSSSFENTFNFLFFCHGKETDFKTVKIECDKHINCKVFPAVPKDVLFHIMNKCRVGIQYYNPDVSVNHLYASPSKLYEYLGLGLNVVSSKNVGIDKIIINNGCGVCFDNTQTIYDGLQELKTKGMADKEHIKKVFSEKYAYEIDAERALDEIFRLIG